MRTHETVLRARVEADLQDRARRSRNRYLSTAIASDGRLVPSKEYMYLIICFTTKSSKGGTPMRSLSSCTQWSE